MQDLDISYEEFLQARLRYYLQVKTSRKRGIDWEFTFKTWVLWWREQLGPDWITKRGKCKNQHVMARDGDRGPYAVWNVTAKLASQNVSDQKVNGTNAIGIRKSNPGEKNGRAKLTTDDDLKIRHMLSHNEKVAVIATKFNMSIYAIYRIKKNKSWQETI